jgi:hypothetical protein
VDRKSSRLLACGAQWLRNRYQRVKQFGNGRPDQAWMFTLLPRVAVVFDVWFVGTGAAWAGGGGGWARWASRSIRAGDPPVGDTGEMTLGRG